MSDDRPMRAALFNLKDEAIKYLKFDLGLQLCNLR
jgi:hypothetical protein